MHNVRVAYVHPRYPCKASYEYHANSSLPSLLIKDASPICHWALCYPTPFHHSLIIVTMETYVAIIMAQLLIAYHRNVLLTNERQLL